MALLIDVLVEVGAVVGVSAIDKPSTSDRTCVALQVFNKEKPLLIVMVFEYESWRKEMECGQVLLVMRDTADLESPEATGELLILCRKCFDSLSKLPIISFHVDIRYILLFDLFT